MNHTVNVGMRLEHLVEPRFVCDIDLVELWSFAAEKLDAIERDFGGIVQTVDNNDLVAMLKKSQGRERSNVASASAQKQETKRSACALVHGGVGEARALRAQGD